MTQAWGQLEAAKAQINATQAQVTAAAEASSTTVPLVGVSDALIPNSQIFV